MNQKRPGAAGSVPRLGGCSLRRACSWPQPRPRPRAVSGAAQGRASAIAVTRKRACGYSDGVTHGKNHQICVLADDLYESRGGRIHVTLVGNEYGIDFLRRQGGEHLLKFLPEYKKVLSSLAAGQHAEHWCAGRTTRESNNKKAPETVGSTVIVLCVLPRHAPFAPCVPLLLAPYFVPQTAQREAYWKTTNTTFIE
jgi:hypothetical protein